MDKAWFEMRAEISRKLADAVWVPLLTSCENRKGEYGDVGFQAEYVGVRSVAIHLKQHAAGEGLSWRDLTHDHAVYAEATCYKSAEVHWRDVGEELGVALVLNQSFDGVAPRLWHLNQDLVFALGLLREGDVWVRPSEGFLEVVRLTRDANGAEQSLSIRSEHLRDYLAARSMALRITTYRSRKATLADSAHVGWSRDPESLELFGGRFEGRAWDIHEGGGIFGEKMAVFHVSRTDVDTESDVPIMGVESEEGVSSRSWVTGQNGRKLSQVEGEFWRDEWIEPSDHSPRVRGDHLPSAASFIIDAAGKRATADELNDQDIGRWLWFSPRLVATVLGNRGASLGWYSQDTGTLQLAPNQRVHFGLNDRDIITVYAFDVACLPEWQRLIWAGFNVAPDGGVSRELTAAQVEVKAASTQAPERYLPLELARMNQAFGARWGAPLLKPHLATPSLLAATHRFRAENGEGLLALAKDLARLTADSFDVEALHRIAPAPRDKKSGSLKSLESALATIVGIETARDLMGPLFGVYDLRLGDAHLPSSRIQEALALAGIDSQARPIQKGLQLLIAVVSTIHRIADVFKLSRS